MLRLVALLSLFAAAPVLAQAPDSTAADAPTGPYREPMVGYLLGALVPGGGHFYAGETGTGAALLGAAVLTTVLSIGSGRESQNSRCTESCIARGAAGLTILTGIAVVSIVGGGRAVRRANRRSGYGVRSPRVAVEAGPGGVAARVRL